MARERAETTPVTTGFLAAQSGSGVRWRKERGREAEGGSGGRGQRLPSALTGWAGARRARELVPPPRPLGPRARTRGAHRGGELLAGTGPGLTAQGCEWEPTRRGRAREGPAWRTPGPLPTPGAPRISARRGRWSEQSLRAWGRVLAAGSVQLVRAIAAWPPGGEAAGVGTPPSHPLAAALPLLGQ